MGRSVLALLLLILLVGACGDAKGIARSYGDDPNYDASFPPDGGDTDTDSDGDTDGDTDTDSDSDSDSDSDADGGGDAG